MTAVAIGSLAFLLTKAVGLEAADRWASVIGTTAAVIVAVLGILGRWLTHRSDVATAVDRERARDDVLGVVHARRVQLQSRLVDLGSPLPVPWSLVSRRDALDANDVALPTRGVVDALAEALAIGPPRGLVLLGDRGAGKSTVADLALIRADVISRDGIALRSIPFRIHIGSWDPREDLVSWAARQVDHSCRQADVEVRGGARVIRALIQRGELLLILDGFDELLEPYGRDAMEGMKTAGLLSFVLLSQPEAYRRAGSGLDRVADVVVLGPLSGEVASHELSRGPDPTGAWATVAQRVSSEPTSAVGKVLRWPLFLWLAVRMRSEGLPPPPALETNSPDPSAIEGALLEGVVLAAYRQGPGGWSARDLLHVRRCFRTMSKAMAARGREDFVWWDLDAVIPWGVRAAAGGLITYFVLRFALVLSFGREAGVAAASPALAATLILAVSGASASVHSRWRGPGSRVALAVAVAVPAIETVEGEGSLLARFSGGFWKGLAAALVIVLLWRLVAGIADVWGPAARWLAGWSELGTPRRCGWQATFPKVALPIGAAVILDVITTRGSTGTWGVAMFLLVAGLGSAATCFGRPIPIGPSDRPTRAVWSNLLFAVVASFLWCFALLFPLLLLATSQAWAHGDPLPLPKETWNGVPAWLVGSILILVPFIGVGALFSVVGLTVSRAGRFLVAGAVLAMLRRWPRPTTTFRFLQSAHERGVLRRVGPAHAFAHAALRESLASP